MGVWALQGEYAALVTAGVLSFEDGLRLVKLRGEKMQSLVEEAARAPGGRRHGMLSVAGLERDVLERICQEAATEARKQRKEETLRETWQVG